MAILKITVNGPCPGGNHFTFIGTVGGKSVPVPIDKPRFEAGISQDDAETVIRVLVITFIRKGLRLGQTFAQIKTALELEDFEL